MGESRQNRPRRGRRAYLEDFQKNLSGEYVYTGDVYRWEGDRKKPLALLWLASALALGSVLAAGCIPGTGMEQAAFVMIPYVAAVWGGGSQLWAVFQLTAAGEQVRAYVMDRTVRKLPRRAVWTAAGSGIAFLGELAVIFLPGFSCVPGRAALFLLLQAVQTGEGLWMRRFARRLRLAK